MIQKEWITIFFLSFFVFPSKILSFAQERPPSTCSYSTWTWDVHLKKSVNHQRIEKPYQSLTPEEVDALSGCTVCEEDQDWIKIPSLKPFQMCKKFTGKVRETLTNLISQGEPIFQVVGYRVGKSSGSLDSKGRRTRFSQHSFGIAIDINPDQNGLYDHCERFGSQCRLRRGGAWKPEVKGTLTPESKIVKAMKEIGFRWGGEIAGNQKDFMHFSPSGY